MDKIEGIKTPFASWKMAERIVKKLLDNSNRDQPAQIVVVFVYVSHAMIRTFAPPSKNIIIDILFEILRSISREILHALLRLLSRTFIDDIKLILEEEGFNLYVKETRI